MSHRLARTALAGLAAMALLLAGCATPSTRIAGPAAPKAAASASGSPPASDLGDSDLRDAMGLLYQGQPVAARKRLMKVLRRSPGDPTARSLIQQIDTPPDVLLGTESFAYRTRQDDTLSLLAERFLGDPVRFYALARYNNLPTAGRLEPGLILRIPGRERVQARPAHPEAAPRPVQASVRPGEPKAATSSGPRANDPRRAALLRGAALEQLDRGSIDSAVALFEQASRLDPANTLIQRDLDRALRISRAVHAKS